MQVMLMRLMSKGEYLIVPKGTKFTGPGKLGLRVKGELQIDAEKSNCEIFESALYMESGSMPLSATPFDHCLIALCFAPLKKKKKKPQNWTNN